MPKNDFGQFTYLAADGKRKPKRYVVAFLMLVVVLGGTIATGVYLRGQEQNMLSATRSVAVVHTVTSTACPADPDDWSLVAVEPDSDNMRIEPSCVYDGLGRTVAWALAIRMGYPRQDATELLGFDSAPALPLADLAILDDLGNPQRVSLSYVPLKDNYTEWGITSDGLPATTYIMRGCFRTYTVSGEVRHDWGDGYPIVCALFQDALSDYLVILYGDHLYTGSTGGAYRRITYFGYNGSGEWIWLGSQQEDRVVLTITEHELLESYATYSELFQTPIWNSSWMSKVLSMNPRPIPDDWQSATDGDELSAIMDLLRSP